MADERFDQERRDHMGTIATDELLHMSGRLQGAPPTAEFIDEYWWLRQKAANWVAANGGLSIVESRYAENAPVKHDVCRMLGLGDVAGAAGYQSIMAELRKRTMPEGLEWPRFEDGEPIAYGDAPDGIAAVMVMLDGSGYELIDMPDYAVRPRGERVKRPEPEAIGADGLPIKIGDTVYLESFGRPFTVVGFDGAYLKDADGWHLRADCATHTPPETQEQIDEDVCKITDGCTYFSSDGSCLKCRFVSQYGDADSAYAACPGGDELERMVVSDLLRRQRELDARTMGGE